MTLEPHERPKCDGCEPVFIPLSKGMCAIIDATDLDIVRKHKWHVLLRKGAACAVTTISLGGNRKRTLYMHRLLCNAPKGMMVDHRNHNSLDNRRDNIRLATNSQNNANSRKQRRRCSSKFKGVTKHGDKWQAGIKQARKTVFLGCFDSERDAAIAYNQAARVKFGEYAHLNEV